MELGTSGSQKKKKKKKKNERVQKQNGCPSAGGGGGSQKPRSITELGGGHEKGESGFGKKAANLR